MKRLIWYMLKHLWKRSGYSAMCVLFLLTDDFNRRHLQVAIDHLEELKTIREKEGRP